MPTIVKGGFGYTALSDPLGKARSQHHFEETYHSQKVDPLTSTTYGAFITRKPKHTRPASSQEAPSRSSSRRGSERRSARRSSVSGDSFFDRSSARSSRRPRCARRRCCAACLPGLIGSWRGLRQHTWRRWRRSAVGRHVSAHRLVCLSHRSQVETQGRLGAEAAAAHSPRAAC